MKSSWTNRAFVAAGLVVLTAMVAFLNHEETPAILIVQQPIAEPALGLMSEPAIAVEAEEHVEAKVEETVPPKPEPVRRELKAKAKSSAPVVSRASETEARVSFGTRSCSSRVSIDGVLVARSTPSYDHPLSPGLHRILIEGTSCPPIERPGALKASLPTVSKELEVPRGARLKLIADFETERLIIREIEPNAVR